jgi:hypothetical protein
VDEQYLTYLCLYHYRSLQELLEVNALSMSMSMSMSFAPEAKDATISPAPAPEDTDPPTGSAVLLAEKLIACAGSANTPISITLEVELALGKTEFAKDLEHAITTALAADGGYSMCDPSRRLAEIKASSYGIRELEENRILLSPVIVTETAQSCSATDPTASSCRVATAEMEAFGTYNSQIIAASVDAIAKNDASFDTELKMNGIMDVRVVPDTNRGINNVEESNPAASNPKSTVRSTQTVVAIILSVAAVTLVVAIILRRGARRRRHLWYGPTMEETYDENQCLGIQPRESFESNSDIDNPIYYSPKPDYPRATSF